jgi:hypothetical protein
MNLKDLSHCGELPRLLLRGISGDQIFYIPLAILNTYALICFIEWKYTVCTMLYLHFLPNISFFLIAKSNLLGNRNYTSRGEVGSLGKDWLP